MLLYRVFAIALLSATAWTSARVLLSLYALSLGAHAFEVGLLVATFNIFPVLLSWPIGRLSDRIGPRLPLIASAVASGIGLLVPFFEHRIPALFVAAALSGLGFSLYLVSMQNLVGTLSRPEERAKNFSTFSLMGATSNFVGPLLAGFSIDHIGYATACVFVVVLSVASGLVVLTTGHALPGGGRKESASAAPVSHALHDGKMWLMLAISSFVKLGTEFFQFYMPIYGRSLGLSAFEIGAVLAAFAVAAFFVRVVLPRLLAMFGEERLLAYAFWVAVVSYVLMPLFHYAVLLAAVAFVFGLGMGCGQPVTTILLFSRSTDGRSGETLGLRLTVNNIARIATPTLFGFVASVLGLVPVFYINAVIMALGGLLTSRTSRLSGRDGLTARPGSSP